MSETLPRPTSPGPHWSPAPDNDRKILPRAELWIVLLYVFFASLWMTFSEVALDWLAKDHPGHLIRLQTFKGLNFVGTTAVLLYIVLRRSFNRWRRAERKLQESEERFEYAAKAATDAIWDWTFSTQTIWWSDGFYRLFGYAQEEVAPTTEWWSSHIHPEDKEQTVAAIRQAIEGGREMWAGEYRLCRKDGSYAHVQDRGYVIRDAAGQPIRVVGGITDFTGRKLDGAKMERSRRQLRALSARLQFLREEERTRIAREIHDELGQTLTGLKMDLRWAEKRLAQETSPTINPILEKIVEAGELADATIASVQRISAELRPSVLEDLGLSAAVKYDAQRFQDRTSVVCKVRAADLPPALSKEVATAAFRIFQEALTNVARHAEATEVQVELSDENGQLVLRVADNGKGIRPSDLDDPKSLGLLGMRERAELLGGGVDFQPGVACGTLVTLRVPMTAEAASTASSPT
jgi:two-component system, NarL family, sensor histidine kinase UhpB